MATQALTGNYTTALNTGLICADRIYILALTGVNLNGDVAGIPDGEGGIYIVPFLPITYRESWYPPIPDRATVKGSTLTNLEIDANFSVLQHAITEWAYKQEWAEAIIANRFMVIVDVFNEDGRAQGDYLESIDPETGEIIDAGYGLNSYKLQRSQSYNHMIRFFNDTPATFIIPSDNLDSFPIGSAVIVSWNGSIDGLVTFAGDGGAVQVVSPDTNNIARRYGKVSAIKTQPNYWEIEGNLEY